MLKRIIMAVLVALGICGACNAGSRDGISSVTPKQFASDVKSDTTAVIIDVRTPQEYEEGHLEGAHLIDFKDTANFDNKIGELPKNKTYYVYCRSGRRSLAAAEKMKKTGLKVIDMSGGILA